MSEQTFSGFVAFVGMPNVGKSTLLNKLLGEKISITSRKAQTTRDRIVGIDTEGQYQAVYVDTPGVHQDTKKKALNQIMNRVAFSSASEVDLVLHLVDQAKLRPEDESILANLAELKIPVILVLNKADRWKNKEELLPVLQAYHELGRFQDIFPISAKKGTGVDDLRKAIFKSLPENPWLYDKDESTDQSLRFRVSELIREQIFRQTGQELPYATAVVIESMEQEDKLYTIHATVYVERQGQKKIIIGKDGLQMKDISQQARYSLEKLLDCKVFLRIWVKVKPGWTDQSHWLKRLGYGEG